MQQRRQPRAGWKRLVLGVSRHVNTRVFMGDSQMRRVRTPGSSSSSISLLPSSSLPSLGGRKSMSPLGPTVSDRLSDMALNLSQREPQSRHRIFAAHAKDTELLKQMVSVLTARAGRVPSRERGIQGSGLIEEGQLYAVCMQELAAQISVHSPALSELAGQVFHGFVGLFQRSVSAEEGRA